MDYNQIFSNEYKKTFKAKELEVKNDLKKFRSQSITHHSAMGTIMIKIKQLRSERKESDLDLLITLFKQSQQKYSEDQIKLSLENDVYPEFIKISEKDELAGYNFEFIIRQLALITAIEDVTYLLEENSSLIGLMYRTDSLDLFELKDYSTPIEYTELYKELYDKLYPKQKQITTTINQNSNSDAENEPLSKLDRFDKAFLFYTMCKMLRNEHSGSSEEKLPLTELLRLNSICDFKDDRFFTNSFRDSVHYKILTKGIEYFEIDQRTYFLHSLVLKLETLQLAQTIKFLKVMRNKQYNNSVNK